MKSYLGLTNRLLASARTTVVLTSLMLGIVRTSAGSTQSPAANGLRPAFAVASVKIVDHPVPIHPYRLDINHDTLRIDAVPLKDIIEMAYAYQSPRVQGGPGWIDDERYDIEAKTENQNATRDEMRAMLQALLDDRFKLAFHKETKQLPVYTLQVAKGGPKLKAAKDDEQSSISRSGDSGMHVNFRKWPVAGLANTLSGLLVIPVRDQTGLTGTYDFELEWSPDPSADAGPSIFAALQEQLGLRLEEGKGLLEVMVIDHIEHASKN